MLQYYFRDLYVFSLLNYDKLNVIFNQYTATMGALFTEFH